MIKTIKDISLEGKRVFVRVDFNVPLGANGEITDFTRIDAALPTIRKLVEDGAKVILASHLGRPDGERVDSMSLEPVAPALAKRLNTSVIFLENCIGEDVENAISRLANGQVVLLENLRFHKGETKK